ncbi:MAG: DNA helicase [Xylanivirga thermophila]|jgi:superfamily I DNA/RNA helicase|uniref:UvrD-helicase domain-containing protein n=1 Tax=Xylanivirga thermophila TaxID=2496273 RepID=UPI0039F52C6A
MIKEPTKEQKEIINCSRNIVVTARPGSGKTYTVIEKIAVVMKDLLDFQGVIAISFTNKASDELFTRCKHRGIHTKQSFFGTIDKFYISQIIIPFAKHLTHSLVEWNIYTTSMGDATFDALNNLGNHPDPEQEKLLLCALKQGKIFLNICGETALYILQNVPSAIQYLKAKYRYIFIDEYQDCGQIQHDIFILLVENGLCGCAVGDTKQAIYGFTNRFPKYLISLINRPDFDHFEITENHRCHQSISDYSLALMGVNRPISDDLRIFKVSIAGTEYTIAEKIDLNLIAIKSKYHVANNNQVAILCKNNGTVQIMNNALNTPSKVYTDTKLDLENSDWARLFCELLTSFFNPEIFAVDIAERYFIEEINHKKYSKTLSLCNDIFSCSSNRLYTQYDVFIKLAKLIYPTHENSIATKLLYEVLYDESLLHNYSPAANNEINIMTIHKSKGLEFNIVFHMDLYKWIFPYQNCPKDEYDQALNLHYVGITRAIDACYMILASKRYRANHDDFCKTEQSPFLSIEGLSERRKNIRW